MLYASWYRCLKSYVKMLSWHSMVRNRRKRVLSSKFPQIIFEHRVVDGLLQVLLWDLQLGLQHVHHRIRLESWLMALINFWVVQPWNWIIPDLMDTWFHMMLDALKDPSRRFLGCWHFDLRSRCIGIPAITYQCLRHSGSIKALWFESAWVW